MLLGVKGVHIIHRACEENDKESGNCSHNGPSNIRSGGFDDGNTCTMSIFINLHEHLWSWLWEIGTHCLAQTDQVDLVGLDPRKVTQPINISYLGCNTTQDLFCRSHKGLDRDPHISNQNIGLSLELHSWVMTQVKLSKSFMNSYSLLSSMTSTPQMNF